MKFKLLVFFVVATVASVASAHMLVPNPGERPTSPRPRLVTVPAEVAAITVRGQPQAARSIRPPVPLLVSRKQSFVSTPKVTPDVAPAPDDRAAPPLGLTETAARTAIEADGYQGVHSLGRESDGTWHGKGLRGTTEVALSVDLAGNVSAD